ncbi:glycoside hydrolase family 65 protein [Catellatospora bangladeshensis]|uniref:Glycoside hydrolase family 65 protein n=1 Tax=Catellatospora bangladeshensis TaxID=310355 RepID=A0A8J3NIC0_9ACTN|nr:glycoside hydrolase family 65 protein [Catellatospora bangladeshensis]GIF82002.1 hypothetical protein Cba03nite_33510 [Catellatospora bangladeshensis]
MATQPISPDTVEVWRAGDLPAYLSNGLIGLRVRHIPYLNGVVTLSGFDGVDPAQAVETFARAPYPLAGDIRVDGKSMDYAPDRVRLVDQRYDFGCGELTSRFVFEPDGVPVHAQVTTFCSRTHPTLVLQETHIRAEHECEITISAGVDPQGVTGEWAERRTGEPGSVAEGSDGLMLWRSYGGLSTCGAAYLTSFDGTDDVRRDLEHSPVAPLRTAYTFTARPKTSYRLRQITSLLPETLHSQPHLQAGRLLRGGQLRGFDTLRELNRQAWQQLWRSRIVLDGAPARWQAMADAAFYYLHSSVHPSSPASMSIFGLAYWPDYHYYRGHVMWDIEVFALPPLLLTYPEAAATILRYRATRTAAAAANAALNGYRGLQFPWESSMATGDEAGPGIGSATSLEHHVGPDIAVAFARYVHATGDQGFARQYAWPVVSGVAQWLASRVEHGDRGYEIRRVTGIAETETPRHNNAFTNIAAIRALREATALGHTLAEQVPDSWADIADHLVIPTIDGGDVIANHDGYQPDQEKGETPEAAAAIFPLDWEPDPKVAAATLHYYLNLGERYAGAPMLSAMLGVYAARLGDRGAALEMFERGYADFVTDPYRITLEYAPEVFPEQPHAGPFTANLGGFLTSCLYGLTGLVIGRGQPDSWTRHPVTMPAGWNGVSVQQLWARGQAVELNAEHGQEHARLKATDGTQDVGETRRHNS